MRRGLENWGNWLSSKAGFKGYRLDATQYIEPSFIPEFLSWGRLNGGFALMEYWVTENQTSPREMQTWVALTENRALVYDGALRDRLHNMCTNGANSIV